MKQSLLPVRKLAWFSFSFAAGCLIFAYTLQTTLSLVLSAIFLAVGLLLFFLLRTNWRIRLLLCLIGLSAGLAWTSAYYLQATLPKGFTEENVIRVSGTVQSDPVSVGYRQRYQVQLDRYGTAYLYTSEDLQPEIGDRIRAEGTLHQATSSTMSKGVWCLFFADSLHITGFDSGWGTIPSRTAHRLQEQLNLLYDGDSAGLFRALLTGDSSEISTSLSTALSRCGLSHMVAVSGLHISILSGLCFLFLRGRKRRLMVLPLLVFFTLMVGSASAWRALLMSSLVLIAPVVRREEDSATDLSAALLVLCLLTPLSVRAVGMQLSFAATAGLILAGPYFNRQIVTAFAKRKDLPKVISALSQNVLTVIATTLSASLFTIPLVAVYFKQISLISVISNLLVVWLLPALLVLGLCSVLISFLFPVLGTLLAFPADLLAKFVIFLVRCLGTFPYAALPLSSIYFLSWFFALLILVAVSVLLLHLRRRPVLPIFCIFASLFLCLFLQRQSVNQNALTAKVLDVGQGQCVLFVSQGHAAAVDCGGNLYDSAGDLLADELQSLGISDLDVLILTHLDSDHVNGIQELFARIQVGTVYIPLTEKETSWRDTLITLCTEQNCQLITLNAQTGFQLGEADVTIYQPVSVTDDNDCSLVSLWSTAYFHMMVTGDLSTKGESLLLARETLPDIDVLVVGHHGSSTSTSSIFLDQILPEAAIISVGADNSFGHPAHEVLTRLIDYEVSIYRTDLNGTTTIAVSQEVNNEFTNYTLRTTK